MSRTGRAESCAPGLHMHVGQCMRAGYANGLADAGEWVDDLARWFGRRLAVADSSSWTVDDWDDLCDGMAMRLKKLREDLA